jgi:hypothetical protein
MQVKAASSHAPRLVARAPMRSRPLAHARSLGAAAVQERYARYARLGSRHMCAAAATDVKEETFTYQAEVCAAEMLAARSPQPAWCSGVALTPPLALEAAAPGLHTGVLLQQARNTAAL